MLAVILMCMLFSFDCSAAELPDDVVQETIVEDTTESTTEQNEPVNQVIVDDSAILQTYDVSNLTSFGYIRELPDSVSLADFYIIVCRIYNLILMAVWILIAFEVIDLVAKSVGRLKRKN